MVTSERLYLAFLGAVAVERLAELALSRRNARRAFARGGVEVGRAHFRVMAGMHGAFLAACALEVLWLGRPFPGPVGLAALALALLAQALRYWVIDTLGDRWNVRIIVVPGAPPVVGGPYRYLRHPNYAAVIVEMIAIPMIHGAWLTALVWSALNALVLAVRIRAEEEALGPAYAARMRGLPRLVPGRRPPGAGELSGGP
ncbi:isoprenylcysteine carboxylmethyltransferase family protein [Sorangium sp. So ce1036]|uniref:isoprenylcysteine carboxyl methyltransferase family protein n=1 Tax=Sorangium sp. So ce1036 TaxID=3133328 RepID=UPI003F0A9297